MKLKKLVPACSLALATMFGATAQAQISGDTIKIGFISDLSGLYADIDGPAGAEAIRMAIADMGGAVVKSLRERGYTIVMVEQNFRFAAPLADRFLVMEHGQVIQQFTQAELPARMARLHEYLGV